MRGYDSIVADTQTITRTQTQTRPETIPPRAWNVVLLNDQEHTYDYVIAMLGKLFGHPLEKAVKIAKAVDSEGRAVVFTTHREHAELKQEQIHGFGRDALMAQCKGSMSAVIEPADFGGDDDNDGKGGKDQGGKA